MEQPAIPPWLLHFHFRSGQPANSPSPCRGTHSPATTCFSGDKKFSCNVRLIQLRSAFKDGGSVTAGNASEIRLCHTDTAGKVKYRRRHADTGIPTRGHRRIRFGSGLGQTRSKPTRFSFKPSFSLYATLPSDSRLSLPRRLPRQHSSAMAGDGDGDIWWRPAAAGDRQYGEERKNSVSVSTYKLWFWRFWISCVYCTATLFETFLLMS
ncbi:uncharacterized protein LOC116261838 isoform X3 [Nymphaea colorata]|nr:uncharacterized protein LOC116261838 isoform X3 [Nymphaea colorata]